MFPEHANEVVEFAKNCRFLFGTEPPPGLDVKVVQKVPDNWMDCGSDGKPYAELETGESTYWDGVATELSAFYGKICNDKAVSKINRKITEKLQDGELFEKVAKNLSNIFEYANDGAEAIVAELEYCAQWRLVFGIKEGLFETMFQIYKSGGMPVGWSGKYPEGRFMVIYPGL